MCGISIVIESSEVGCSFLQVINDLEEVLKNRGPSQSNTLTISLDREPSLHCIASVLHIQGLSITSQPVIDSMGNVFMWNGEVFGGYNSWPTEISDTSMLSSTLEACIAQSDSIYSGIVSVMTRIQGPYAFIYYHTLSRTIFYGRDPFGRRSLLTYKLGNALVALSSVSNLAYGGQWEEVGIGGVYSLSLDAHDVSFHPWPEKQLRLARYPHNVLMRPSLQPSVDFLEHLNRSMVKRLRRCHHTHPISLPPAPASSSSSASAPCKVAVLFSGGIDSLLLAAMLHISLCFMHCSSSADSAMSVLDETKHQETVEVIELLNIVFVNEENDTAPDRLAALAGLSELQRLFPTRQWRLVHIDVTADMRTAYEEHIQSLIKPADTHMDLNIGTAFWFASQGAGYICNYSADQIQSLLKQNNANKRPLLRRGEEQAQQAVGLTPEKLLVQSLRKKLLKEVNSDSKSLVCNVGQCQRVMKVGCLHGACKRCCDRFHTEGVLENWKTIWQQQRQGLMKISNCSQIKLEEEGFGLSPNPCPVHGSAKGKNMKQVYDNLMRIFTRWIENNRDDDNQQSLASEQRDNNDTDSILITPKNNTSKEEDEAMERQQGDEQMTMTDEYLNKIEASYNDNNESNEMPMKEDYRSTCVALLVGIGADEQLAGYARHRTTFMKGGEEALVSELNMDLTRLWTRNLGRDDRCISDHGKEAWFPYLDEDLVEFIQNLPLNQVADLNLGQGVGDKRILRDAARLIGLEHGADLVKRAIQFGSLAAKQTSKQYFGSKRKGKGTSKINHTDHIKDRDDEEGQEEEES